MLAEYFNQIFESMKTLEEAVSLRYSSKDECFALAGLTTQQLRYLVAMDKKIENILQTDLLNKAGVE